MKYQIDAAHFASNINCLRYVQDWKKHPNYLRLNAENDHLIISGTTIDTRIDIRLGQPDSYKQIHIGSVILDYQFLLRALDRCQLDGLITVHYDDDVLCIEGHRGWHNIFVPAHMSQPPSPIEISETDQSAFISAQDLWRGMNQVRFAASTERYFHKYKQIFIQFINGHVVFCAGNGARFVLYQVPRIDDIAQNELCSIHVPIELVKVLLKMINPDSSEQIQFAYHKDESMHGMPPALMIKVKEYTLYNDNDLDEYPDVYGTLNDTDYPYQATIDLRSWAGVINTIKPLIESSNKCHYTKLIFDFGKGHVTVVPDEFDGSQYMVMGLALGQNTPQSSDDTPIVLECASCHILEMYTISHLSGKVIIKFDTPLHENDESLNRVRIDFPKISSPDGILEEFQMFFGQRKYKP
jgi:hypothetical protein